MGILDYREFTKTDWDCFAGAEPFTTKKNPLIWEYYPINNEGHVSITIVCDKNGFELYMYSDDPDEEFIIYQKELHKSWIQMEGEMKNLIYEVAKYNYAPDLAFELDHTCDSNKVLGGFKTIAN